MEAELSSWIDEQRNENLCVSRKLIQEKALDLANKKGLIDFKASLGRIEKMKKKKLNSVRTRLVFAFD